MEERARNALELSIEHWERMATGIFLNNEKPSADDCALCNLYFNNDCEGCPVKQHTGITGCRRTPYLDAFDEYEFHGMLSEEFKAAATVMKEFLEGLRDV